MRTMQTSRKRKLNKTDNSIMKATFKDGMSTGNKRMTG